MTKILEEDFVRFYLPGIIAAAITIAMIIFPKEAFEAALNGVSIWWNIVFPALLPFFIFSQVLIGLGVVHFLGVLLEPVMRPVFNVPGAGSFVMAMGLASGFPIGAVLTSKLRLKKLCNKEEAERLISFVNTADPLFMFGAVAVGMLHAPQTGLIIAAAHYLSSISVGLIMRFYKARSKKKETFKPVKRENILIEALKALVRARKEDSRPIGRLLGEAIKDSINTLLLIGGFIILFSVIITLLRLVGVVEFLSLWFSMLLTLTGLDSALSPALVSGLFEIDLGCQMAASLQGVEIGEKIITISAIIAWSGLSVHAQVASIISPTDISIFPYIFARAIHAILAGLYALLLLGPLGLTVLGRIDYVPVFRQTLIFENTACWYQRTLVMGERLLFILVFLIIISLLIYYYEKIKVRTSKGKVKYF